MTAAAGSPPLGAAPGCDLGPERVAEVARLLGPRVRRTPVVIVDRAELGLPPGPLALKLEHLQHTGSFKVRGALANLLLGPVPAAGVVAASGGNHGAAVAYAAGRLGVPATIFVPETSSPAKVERIRGYGADLVVAGRTYADALAASREHADSSGARQVHAFDQVETVLGAATVGLELRQQVPEADVVLAAVGGGGLLAGIAVGHGDATIVGAEPQAAPTLSMALAAGRPVDAPAGGIAVDSLAPRRVGERTFAVLARRGARSLLVSDEEIRHAQRVLWDRLRLVVEPGGCAALAAVLAGRLVELGDPSGRDASGGDASGGAARFPVVVLSGANTDPATVGG